MPRKQYLVQVTGGQREDIDPDQIAQILLDLILQESDTELAAPDQRESPPASWGSVRRIERPQSGTPGLLPHIKGIMRRPAPPK
jgi:hypothetical protein